MIWVLKDGKFNSGRLVMIASTLRYIHHFLRMKERSHTKLRFISYQPKSAMKIVTAMACVLWADARARTDIMVQVVN
jgi:hypothetical protein